MTTNTNTASDMRANIAAAFAARIERERAALTLNANKEKNLTRYAKEVDHDNVAAVLVACNFDAQHVNQNCYAVEKMIDAARYAVAAAKIDVYTSAAIASMIALEKAQIEVTRDVVAMLCTNDVKTKFDAKIKTTRVQTVKSQSTVATQHNSTLNAMRALDMIATTRNASNDDVFTLNRENVIVKAFAERNKLDLAIAV